MSIVAEAINNTLAVVASVVPTRAYNGNKRFQQLKHGEPSHQATTRRFWWVLTGDLSWAGDQVQKAAASGLVLAIEVILSYATGQDTHEFQIMLAEDLLALQRALYNPEGYDPDVARIWRRTVGTARIELAGETGAETQVTLPISLQFDAE